MRQVPQPTQTAPYWALEYLLDQETNTWAQLGQPSPTHHQAMALLLERSETIRALGIQPTMRVVKVCFVLDESGQEPQS